MAAREDGGVTPVPNGHQRHHSYAPLASDTTPPLTPIEPLAVGSPTRSGHRRTLTVPVARAPPPASPAAPQAPQSPAQSPAQSQGASRRRRSLGEWDFVKTIGAGSMGQVKLARNRRTQALCAVKVVPRAHADKRRQHKTSESDEAKDTRTIREANLGRLIYHPYICKLYEVQPMTNHFYMFFEYVAGGQMLDYIISHGSLKEKQARKFARSIASALDYLHQNSIVHRDLKIENILISKSGDIKIIDFGLSNMYAPNTLLKTFCGSLYFAAPELLKAYPYVGPEVDVWSFGIVLYVLVCGKVPFDDHSMPALHEKIKQGRVEYPNWLSSDCRDVLARMLVVNPADRAGLDEVMAHPWMVKGYDRPPESYVPPRTPLTLPLDPEITREMAGFEFGSQQDVERVLTGVVESPEYQAACDSWYKEHAAAERKPHRRRLMFGENTYPARSQSGLCDPTKAFHPLCSIYYLVKERRERATLVDQQSFSLSGSSPATATATATNTATATATVAGSVAVAGSAAVPVLAKPEPAIQHAPNRARAKTQGTVGFMDQPLAAAPVPPPSQQYTPPRPRQSMHQSHASEPNASLSAGKNLTSLLRRFSTKKRDSVNLSPAQKSPRSSPQAPPQPQSQPQTPQAAVQRAASVKTPPQRYHPNARAKSLGHTALNRNSLLARPDAFEDVALDESPAHETGEMLSIEYPRQVLLKGFFSVQSTSTKPLEFIRSDIIRVLSHLGVEFTEIKGGFVCAHRASIASASGSTDSQTSPPMSPSAGSTPDQPPQRGHWRKLSFGSGMFRKRGESSGNIVESDISTESMSISNPPNGGSDMLNMQTGVSNSQAVRTPLRFELYIVKFPLLGLHGVQFKKMTGNSWQYKNLATKILSELKL